MNATYVPGRWSRQRREFLADDLLGRDCPECGDTMHYSESKPPWFNPPGSWSPVIFGRDWCTNYGGCVAAPG